MDTRKFFIRPSIPEKLAPLVELSANMWTCWDKDAEKLFHRLNPQLFRKLNHNPTELLYKLEPERLNEAARDKGFLYEMKQVYDKYQSYMTFEGTYTVGGEEKKFSEDNLVVYTCMEYGIHESLPIYSGGLAVLAGDQLKAASDMGFPMVGFGLLYRHGYFNQHIMPDGTQIEEFRENTWFLSAVKEVHDSAGNPLHIEVPLKGEKVIAKIWKIQVGKVPLYLLDTNIHQNPPKFRKITNMLYDSDRATRLEQELILGRGAIIALDALDIHPKVFHLNEGHTAFSILERLLHLINDKKMSFDEAKTVIRFSTVFTTHTPVVEGNEHFSDELIMEYLANEVRQLGMSMDEFLALGKIKREKLFWLPAFALRFSSHSNGVSNIHAGVSRSMWQSLFPTLHEREIPIDGITNGAHLPSWLSLQMTELLDRYIGEDYLHMAEQKEAWDKINTIPDGEIWNAHRRRKEQVVSFIRRRVSEMMINRGYGKNKIKDVEEVLNPDYLTIGFARRFATYKRANLLLSNPDRLAAILTNKDKPVQIIFAGKAHPADGMGKNIIKQIFEFINKYNVENHVVFIEDYDINIARHMVQGVDVWLNTPIKPMEASGTSGIKAAFNGVLNLSILDGWWPEAYNGENGWAIVSSTNSDDPAVAMQAEANQLYELLENEITEAYYNRTESDIPMEWVKMMKSSISTVSSGFNMHRAIRDYLHKCYLPQAEIAKRVLANNGEVMKNTIKMRSTIDSFWPNIFIKDFFSSIDGKMPVSGEEIDIDCYASLGDLDEKMVQVEIFYCYGSSMKSYMTVPLKFVEKYQDKVAKYIGKFRLSGTGMQEISARIVPADEHFRKIFPEYIKWKL